MAMALTMLPSLVSAQEPLIPTTFTVLNYETGWTHDGDGYHPAVFLLIENGSGRDLTPNTIKFQARFTDLETTAVTLGRKNVRRSLKPNQQFTLALEGRESSDGVAGFELPFEIAYWPKLELKVMCRVGDVDAETETMLITKLEPQTRSQDEAFEHLNQSSSYNPNPHHHHRSVAATSTESRHRPEPVAHSDRPQTATADRYGATTTHKVTPGAPITPPPVRKIVDPTGPTWSLLNGKSLPGLGDDFFNFEQRYGLPSTIDAKQADWTWAKYKHSSSGIEILAGAKDRGANKVDLIILRVPRNSGVDQSGLVNAARQMTGKYRTQVLPQAARSVRYLPAGRLELATSSTPNYKVICMVPPASSESDNSFILVVSRLPQEVESLLAGLSRKSSLLKQFQFLDNKESN